MRIVQSPIKIGLLLFFTHAYCMEQPIAYVQHNTGISAGEQEFRTKRLPIVKAALEKKFNCTLKDEQVPTIAIIGSGGGYRAMLYFIATLHRAYKAGIIDALTYVTALSGSTWAVAPWIATGKPIDEFKTYIQKCAAKPFNDINQEEKLLIANTTTIRNDWNLIHLYGNLLAHRLLESLGDKKYTICLSDQAEQIKNGTYPYPICVAIDGRNETAALDDPTVYEFTPHTISEHTNNTEIPSWGDGRTYEHDKSTNAAPENNLAYDLATWGSAFGASIKEILEDLLQNHPELLKLIEYICTPIEGRRIVPCYADLPNYLYESDIPTIADKTLLIDNIMRRVDAGLKNNFFNFSPVSGICPERTADILIFIDMSSGELGPEFKKATDYAHKHNLPFPPVDFTDISKKTMSIFTDEHNKKTPTVIYMPRISDQQLWQEYKNKPEFKDYNLSGFNLDDATKNGFAQTYHFQYTIPDSTLVMNQAEFNFHVKEDEIWQAIEWKTNR